MNLKTDEVMAAFANILDGIPADQPEEATWHSTVNLPDATPDLSVDQIMFQTNAIVSTAEKDQLADLREKLVPFKNAPDMIEEAHPEPAYVSSANSDGGLVENQNELHEKLLQMINKYPSGSTGHKYASLVEDLLKVAQELDSSGNFVSANLVDTTALYIADFVKKNTSVTKQAIAPLALLALPYVWGPLAALIAGGAGWWAVKGKQDTLVADLQKLAGNIDSWKDDEVFSSFKTRIYQLRDLVSQLQAATHRWMQASQIHAEQKSQTSAKEFADATQDLTSKYEEYTLIRDEIIKVKAAGAFFPLFRKYDSNVAAGLGAIIGLAQEQGARAREDSAPDEFDSAEMEQAVQEMDEAPSQAREPLDERATMQTQLFINEAYRPIAAASGVIDDAWLAGIKEMVNTLRGRLQRAAAIQDPESAAETGAVLNISKFIQMNRDGTYSLLVDATDLNKILNLVETAEDQARALHSARTMKPHESLLQ